MQNIFNNSGSDNECAISGFRKDSSHRFNYRFLNYTFMTGYRRDSNLLYSNDEKQFYRFNSKNKSGDAYVCAEIKKNCKARVYIQGDKKCVQQEKYSVHTHGTQLEKMWELLVLNLVKDKCADISTLINERKQSFRDIFYSIVSKYPRVQLNFYTHERSLQTIRNNALPRNPKTANDISEIFGREDVMALLGTTKDDKPFYNGAFESQEFSFCMFSSPTTIELLEKNEKYGERVMMMDGTFAVVPIGSFNQLFIIYTVYLEKVDFMFFVTQLYF